MSDWEEPTESILGLQSENSLEIDVDFGALPPSTGNLRQMSPDAALQELWPTANTNKPGPDLVVFDPMGFRLAEHMATMGFPVRNAVSGVEVMSMASGQPTGAVVCGPAEDAERRRLLTAALRLRFPEVPVIYVSTHANNPEAVRGAQAEGAQQVIPIPLPGAADLERLLGDFVKRIDPASRPPKAAPKPAPKATPKRPAPEVTMEDEYRTQPISRADIDEMHRKADAAEKAAPAEDSSPFNIGRSDVIDEEFLDGSDEFALEVRTEVIGQPWLDPQQATAPVPKPTQPKPPASVSSEMLGSGHSGPAIVAPRTQVGAEPGNRGELGDLISAISPFLWGLEDASNWAQRKADDGDMDAMTHARTLKLLTKLIEQLQQRIDKKGV